jgi:hypothetical protein
MGSSTVNIYPQPVTGELSPEQPVTGELSPEDYVLLQASLKKAQQKAYRNLPHVKKSHRVSQIIWRENPENKEWERQYNRSRYLAAKAKKQKENAMSQQTPESSSNETTHNGGKRKITKRKKSAKRRMTKRSGRK